jgi:hypothetical protein
VLFGARFFVDVSRERGGDSLVAPFLSVGAVSTATGTDHTPLGGTALRWQALVGALGPLAIPLFTRAVFRPCAVFEAGRVRGEGIDVANARRTDAAWIGLGVAGHLEVVIVPNLLIELEVGASAPIVWPRFDYSSGATAYRPAELGGRGSLGFAFRL